MEGAAVARPPVRGARSLVALSLLGNERIVAVLHVLAGEAMQPVGLNAVLIDIPHATLMSDLGQLHRLGAVRRRAHEGMPHGVTYSITDVGRDLLTLADAVGVSSAGAIGPDGIDCDATTFAQGLDAGWSASLFELLGAEPLGVSELARLVTSHTTHQVQGRLRRMERAGLVARSGGRRPRYGLTPAARGSMAVVFQAIRWQREATSDHADQVDLAASLFVALPGLEVTSDSDDGVVVCTVECDGSASSVCARVKGGVVTGVARRPALPPDAWVHGQVDSWLEALVLGRRAGLAFGGAAPLAWGLLRALRV